MKGGRSSLWLKLLCALALLVPAGCSGGAPSAAGPPAPAAPAASPAGAADPAGASVSTQPVGWSGPLRPVNAATAASTGIMATVWVAKDKGIFEKHGLDVNLSAFGNGQIGMAALLSQQVDFLQVDGVPTANAAIQGGDAVVVATTHGTLISSLYVRPEFKDPQTLKGQSIGITGLGTPNEMGARVALKALGLEVGSDTSLQGIGTNSEIVPAILSGRVAGGILSYPAIDIASQRGLIELVDVGKLAAAKVAFTGITIQRRLLREQRDTVRDYVAAQIESGAYMLKNKQDTIATMAKYLNLDDPAILERTYEIYIQQYFQRVPLPTAESFAPILELLSTHHPQAITTDPAVLFDDSIVRELQQSGYIDRTYREYGVE